MRRETASRGFLLADMYKFEIAPSDSIAEKEIQIEFQVDERWLGDGVWSVATAFNLITHGLQYCYYLLNERRVQPVDELDALK